MHLFAGLALAMRRRDKTESDLGNNPLMGDPVNYRWIDNIGTVSIGNDRTKEFIKLHLFWLLIFVGEFQRIQAGLL